jgi:hypothetical protein
MIPDILELEKIASSSFPSFRDYLVFKGIFWAAGRRQPWELPHDVTAITTFFFFPFSSGFSACAGAWSDLCHRVKAETEEVWGIFVFIAGGAMSEFKAESSSGTIAGSNVSGPAANSYVLYLSPEDDRYQK